MCPIWILNPQSFFDVSKMLHMSIYMHDYKYNVRLVFYYRETQTYEHTNTLNKTIVFIFESHHILFTYLNREKPPQSLIWAILLFT